MMLADILDALTLQLRDAFRMKNKLFNFFKAAFKGRKDIDDRSKLRLAKYLVVLRFAPSYVDDAL
jgi:hypothetical protein